MLVELSTVFTATACLMSLASFGLSLASYVKVLASEKSTHTIYPAQSEQPKEEEVHPELEKLLSEPFADEQESQEIPTKDLEEQLLRGI